MSRSFTFEPARHCRLAGRITFAGAAPFPAGQEGALNLLLVEEGRCETGEEPVLPAGSLLLFPAPVLLRPLGFCRVTGVALAGEAVSPVTHSPDGPLCYRPSSNPGHLADAAALLRALGDPALEGAARQSAMGYELLCRLSALDPSGRAVPATVENALELIRTHYAEVYGVEELAVELGLSKGHLIRTFTAALGISPGRYLLRVRLEAVKQLLLHREYSLEVVAGLCGFSGANYLCRIFKKEEGVTPSAWRRAHTAAGHPLPPGEGPAPPVLEEGLYL